MSNTFRVRGGSERSGDAFGKSGECWRGRMRVRCISPPDAIVGLVGSESRSLALSKVEEGAMSPLRFVPSWVIASPDPTSCEEWSLGRVCVKNLDVSYRMQG